MSQTTSNTTRMMSIGERISSLSSLPVVPEENWRRTDPADFFIPADEVVNSFGQSVIGSHLASSPYKIQFKSVTAEQMKEAVSRLFGNSGLAQSETPLSMSRGWYYSS